MLTGCLRDKSLTMTYFHRRPSTIIGAKVFHCPVRDGKEWDHLAMVVRRNLLLCCGWGNTANWGQKHSSHAECVTTSMYSCRTVYVVVN